MRILLIALLSAFSAFNGLSQAPPIEPGVSQELARWRAVRFSDVRYKLNLTLEKMSPVLKGTMEIKLQYAAEACAECPPRFIVLDWRKIRGHEEKSTISNVSINGRPLSKSDGFSRSSPGEGTPKSVTLTFAEQNEHLVFSDGVVMGENFIKFDFTSPILASGSAITRYVDKEDGSEYIYSLFVPSDASTAFPVFDQPDLKAKFSLTVGVPYGYGRVISNTEPGVQAFSRDYYEFPETKPISTYVFAFAAGPWEERMRISPEDIADLPITHSDPAVKAAAERRLEERLKERRVPLTGIYVRKSQAAKFEAHSKEVFRLNSEAIKYFEQYFDYKFPFPKYDLVLIPEFPFGGMEHAGATFLRESSIIFPQEPTKNDLVSRATLIFHEAAHQWFGDTVTMRWFDDLWLKEGFATFTAYKAMEKIMPEMNSWKVFYERIKQGAYQTDSTKGTTPIYQEIKNLSAAKSAYGNIVYNKAPAFLRQAEFYLGEDKFQTAVRAFLKKHEFGNAGWEDLVKEFEKTGGKDLNEWAKFWVTTKGLFKLTTRGGFVPIDTAGTQKFLISTRYSHSFEPMADRVLQPMKFNILVEDATGKRQSKDVRLHPFLSDSWPADVPGFDAVQTLVFPNYQDYGYGIFLLDEKSREYVLKNIQNEKDPFLRSMMWGSLWDSVREGELDPREYVELVVKVLSKSDGFSRSSPAQGTPEGVTLTTDDESTVASLLGRVGTAMNYYMSEPPASVGGRDSAARSTAGRSDTSPPANAGGSDKGLQTRLENLLIDRMRNAETAGQRITFYRAFLNVAQSENARKVLKEMLGAAASTTPAAKPATPPIQEGSLNRSISLKTKDRFDIVTRLLILNDPDAAKLLADLEKTETTDDAKRYAYAAKAGIPTAENKAKYWNDFTNNKEISESWIEAAFGPWNSIRHADLTLPYLQKALQELPNHKRNRKIFFVNGWLGAFIGGQRSEEALNIVNRFLADNPNLDRDLRLKILENVDVIERAVKIRGKYR